jgi:tetratricopeptide (TPR) repeat protein
MPFVKRTGLKNLKQSTDVRKIFIGRVNELHFFIEHILKPEDPSYNIVSVSGEGGVGKSTLLARFIDEAHSQHFKEYCLTALVDEQQTTPFTIMESFATQVGETGQILHDFEKALTRYKEAVRKLQVERESAQDTAVRGTVDLVGTVAEEVPVVGGLLHKGANLATDLYLKDRHVRQVLKDSELLEDPISDLTKVFVEELNRLTDKQVTHSMNRTKSEQRVILFFDTFEQLANEVAPWLLDHFLQANVSTNIVLVIAGRDSIERSTPNDPKRWLRYQDDVLYLMNLDSFTEDETRAYLSERGITDPTSLATIWQLSKGLPLYLGLLTFNLQENIDPTADVVANFLRWIPEHEHVKRQQALDAALFSRPFNQDDLTAFPYQQEDECSTFYRWLTGLPFVRRNPQDGRYHYHNLAQGMFRRHLYQLSPKAYYATCHTLADHYRLLLGQILEERGKEASYSGEWLELTLALAYQLFYLPDETSHIAGIEQVLNAYSYSNAEEKKEIIRLLRDVSQEHYPDKKSTDRLHIARQLLTYVEALVENQTQNLVEAASSLLKSLALKPTFSSVSLAQIYDYRGDAYTNLKEYQRAIADFDRALELNPSYTRAYNNRGNVYLDLKEYQRAIADYERAIELDPKPAYAYRNRGLAYRNLKEYQRAIADYERAIELDPSYALAYDSRGDAYYDLKEYQRAIADYERAIELDPSSVNGYFGRGLTYLWLKDVDQAESDFARSWKLDSTAISCGWMAEWSRMCQHRADSGVAERLEAIAEVDSHDYSAHVCRGVALWIREHFNEALIELELAISLNSEDWDAYFWQGMINASMSKEEEASLALEKALSVNLPHILLVPLHWLEQDKPDFYKKYAIPLLTRYK